MTSPAFDAERYTAGELASWNEAAAGWHRWAPDLARWLDPATEVMLDLAGVRAGSRVLGVAAGDGGQTLVAARRVGPTGWVLATDLSPAMLANAAAVARREGLTWIETRVMDVQRPDLPAESFDTVISRLGLMLFPDPIAALAGLRPVLKAGGTVGVIVVSTPERNGFLAIAAGVLRRRAQLPPPPPGRPGVFALGAPGALERVFEAADFQVVRVQAVAAPLRMASAADCIRLERDSFPALRQMVAGLSAAERQAAWREAEQAMQQFVGPDGFEAPCELLIGVGKKG